MNNLFKLLQIKSNSFDLYTLDIKILKYKFSDLTPLNILVLIWKTYKCGKYVIKYITADRN